MRLLDTTTLKLHEFFGSEIPYYAILSHRWGDQEVTFQDLQQGRGPSMAGWAKIAGCCAQARKEGWVYAWIDSCCIDKSSSSELSEAINSMFQWYRDAQVCYAYLTDVPVGEKYHERIESAFRNSAWFTRGWTLQELLAPNTVVFFNHGWEEIGTKSSFDELIASITNIDKTFLKHFRHASVAQKFSWASRRQSLRIEDTAYSLMGLFGVHMPLLYGEGPEAFMRLQLEIMKSSDDDSLFAWANPKHGFFDSRSGLLAPSVKAFESSGYILTGSSRSTTPYSMTNKGLHISLMLIPELEALERGILVTSVHRDAVMFQESDLFVAPLTCYSEFENLGNKVFTGEKQVVICLGRVSAGNGQVSYARIFSDRLEQCPSDAVPSQLLEHQIFIPQPRYFQWQPNLWEIVSKFTIRAERSLRYDFGFSSYTGDSRQLNHSSIKTGGPTDKVDTELEPIIDIVLESYSIRPSKLFVEFRGLNGPRGFQEGFFLGICWQLQAARPAVGIILLAPNRKSLTEISNEASNIFPFSRDRDTLTFPSAHVLSAALRKQVDRNGKLMYVVDLDLKSLLGDI